MFGDNQKRRYISKIIYLLVHEVLNVSISNETVNFKLNTFSNYENIVNLGPLLNCAKSIV